MVVAVVAVVELAEVVEVVGPRTLVGVPIHFG